MDTKTPTKENTSIPSPPTTSPPSLSIAPPSPKSIHDETSSLTDTTTSSTSENSPNLNTIHQQKHYAKPHYLPCFALELLEKHGSIYPFRKEDKFYILKFQKINIEDNFPQLLEKGKKILGNYFQQEVGSIPEMSFWYQRYYYYEKFDEGIEMDYESWYSVTPEPIAKYIALFTKGKSVIDGFCGSGGNVIQFSKYASKVIAVDIEEKKLNICKSNCKVYQCQDNIEFILGDYLNMVGKIKADYVFLSPPWGGVKYKDSNVYSIKKLMTPDIFEIVKVSLSIAKKILFYVPRNLDIEELLEVVSTIKNKFEKGTGDKLCFDFKILKSNSKIKALLIIFGYELDEMIKDFDIQNYLLRNYEFVNLDNSKIIKGIIENIGYLRFFENEFFYKTAFSVGKNINFLVKFFMNNVLNNLEKNKVKLKSYVNTNNNVQNQKNIKDDHNFYFNKKKCYNYTSMIKYTNLDVNKTFAYSHLYNNSYQHF